MHLCRQIKRVNILNFFITHYYDVKYINLAYKYCYQSVSMQLQVAIRFYDKDL